ncbi:MAG: hypothetical protein HYT63_03690 [Candidatus Yanofskybacteria bacterium]|nr:hypothetical protein [Candidatus Yanofskybacteria bacterium]
MRYKAVSLAVAILLIATPVYSQEKSYIVVETPRTAEPTVVITGQPFVQTYVIRFIDLTDSGESIIVLEEALDLKALGEFEVLAFFVDKQTKQRDFLEHIWRLRYTLRIINPKKGPYAIPPISVPWKHKKAGQEKNDPAIQVNYDFKTDEVHINYVTTIPEKEISLEVREEVNFGNFDKHAWTWRGISWFLLIIPLGVWLIVFVRAKRSQSKDSQAESSDVFDQEQVLIGVKPKNLSNLKTWLNLRLAIRYLKNCQTNGSGQLNECLGAEAEVVSAIRDFLMARIPGLNIGSTPLNMTEYIRKNSGKFPVTGDVLLQLAQQAVLLQSDLEKNGDKYSGVPSVKAEAVSGILAGLRFHRIAGSFVRHKFSRAGKFILEKFRGGRR